jgi:NB-ARC domain
MRVIIESLTEIPCDITDLEVLKETTKEELKDQRLLLLMDNFESKSQKCWDLLALIKVCKDKSAVVISATREAVAKVKGPMKFFYMNTLPNEWCWMIFKQSVFYGGNLNADTELADVGKLLVAKCRNVPLCVRVISGLLRHFITGARWRAVLDNNLWEMDDVEGVHTLPALRVCYEYLPSHLKQCFKYCSLFPKEYIFSKDHLVCLWLSEGFIEPGENRELEDIGTEYFNQLLSLSFFQPSLIPGRKEDKFVMPGLIYDLAQQFSKNECFQFEGCMHGAPENICRLSLVPHEFQSVSPGHLTMRAQNLLTFLVVNRTAFHNHSIYSSILSLVHLKDHIVKFHNLITLNLSNSDIEELPESIGSLTNLRYLSLSCTKIKRIPLEISNLIHLLILEAKDCHYLEELPISIEALIKLRYLDVTKEAGYVVMPHGIGNLTQLRSLATLNVGNDPLVHCGIGELKDMEHLKGCLQISGLVNVRSGSDANKAHMRSKEHIETLCFHWSDEISFLEGEKGAEIAEEVLKSLHPTDNLKELIIRDYPGNSFPKWIECAAFTRLVSIIFDHCYTCERLPALGGLPLLRYLSIQKMYSVQRINLSGAEYIPENIIRYPSLEQLNIWEMYELVEWVEIGNGNFPVLHSLSINKCPLLKNIPKLPALIEFSAYSCAQFLDAMDLPSIQSLRIVGLQKTKSFNLPKTLVELKKLEISHCSEPLSIEGLTLLNSL